VRLRTAKVLLVAGVAIFHTLLVFDNSTDYGSNYQFVRHVLMMDSTFPENHGMWRAINSLAMHTLFYLSIIAWETATTVLCSWGAAKLGRALHGTAVAFESAK